jgi:hypothetical protein
VRKRQSWCGARGAYPVWLSPACLDLAVVLRGGGSGLTPHHQDARGGELGLGGGGLFLSRKWPAEVRGWIWWISFVI